MTSLGVSPAGWKNPDKDSVKVTSLSYGSTVATRYGQHPFNQGLDTFLVVRVGPHAITVQAEWRRQSSNRQSGSVNAAYRGPSLHGLPTLLSFQQAILL